MASPSAGSSFRSFPNVPESAGEARRYVRDVLARLPESVDLDAAVLLTDELVANAIRHTGSDHFEVHVTLTDGGVRVGVIDADPRMPAARIPAPDDVPSLGASAAGRI